MSAPTTSAPALPPLFRLTGGDDFSSYVKGLLTGPPKSGKTSFLGTIPNIVIADTEPHANNLQSVAHLNLPYVTINGSADLQRLLFVLGDPNLRAQAAEQLGMPKIEGVAIDTMDTLQGILKRERMVEQRTSKFVRDDWAWLKDEMVTIVESFTRLPMHVFFTVHIKTQTIGPEDDQSTIYLPGLQGSIDQEIAGMVGYSFLTFRREEVRPDGTPYTRYLLRSEGNDTYNFLGNRIGNQAVKLPDVIEPKFQILIDAIQSGRAQITAPTQPQFAPAATAQAVAAAPPAPQALPAPTQEVAQSPGQAQQPVPAQTAPVQTPVQTAPAATQATPSGEATDSKPGDDEAVTPQAATYVKRVYDACSLQFSDAITSAMNLGQARQLVKMWQAIQADKLEGKLEGSPVDEMAAFLLGMGWLSDADKARIEAGGPAAAPAPAPPVADVAGTIDQVMAYVGDDLIKAQEAYDLEVAKAKPRATLVNQLTAKGVKVQTPVQNEPPTAPAEAAPAPAPQPEEPVAPPAPAVTQEAPPADVPQSTDQQAHEAVALVSTELGAVPLNAAGQVEGCEEGEPHAVDDEDIATLSQSRFGRRLCVEHYIAETKKSH